MTGKWIFGRWTRGPTTARYEHVRTGFSFDLPYPALVRVERYELPKPFIKYFNMNWVRIITDAPGVPPDLLLSLTGSGTEMRTIRQTNDLLFRELQLKLQRQPA